MCARLSKLKVQDAHYTCKIKQTLTRRGAHSGNTSTRSLEEDDLSSRSAQSICRAECSVNWAPLESPLWLVFKYFGYTLLQNPALCNNTYKHLFGFLKLGCYTCPACVCPHGLSIASPFTDFSQAVQTHQAVNTWASTSFCSYRASAKKRKYPE